MLLPANMSAQEQNGRDGGLFGGSTPTASRGLMNRSGSNVGGDFTGQGFGATYGNLTGQSFGATNGNITGQTFGTPIGSGLFVLLLASVVYATAKSSKSQNRKDN